MMSAVIVNQIEELECCFAEFRTTDANPCGGSAYYDEDDERPWRVHFADGALDESFYTFGQARDAIETYVEEMRK